MRQPNTADVLDALGQGQLGGRQLEDVRAPVVVEHLRGALEPVSIGLTVIAHAHQAIAPPRRDIAGQAPYGAAGTLERDVGGHTNSLRRSRGPGEARRTDVPRMLSPRPTDP